MPAGALLRLAGADIVPGACADIFLTRSGWNWLMATPKC
jgi:hypothetical protein